MPPTAREIRELKKQEMAHRRKNKERIQALKKKGLVEYEGKVIPVMEAHKQGGMKGKVHGFKGAKSGLLGKDHGFKGGFLGFLGKEHGEKGKNFCLMGKEDGIKGKEHAIKGAKHGIKGTEEGIKGKEEGIKGKEDGIKGMAFGVLGAHFGHEGGIYGQLCSEEVLQKAREHSQTIREAAAQKKNQTPGNAIIQVINDL